MVGIQEVSWRGKSWVVPSFLGTASERRAMPSMEQDVVWGKDDDLVWVLLKAELEARIWVSTLLGRYSR